MKIFSLSSLLSLSLFFGSIPETAARMIWGVKRWEQSNCVRHAK